MQREGERSMAGENVRNPHQSRVLRWGHLSAESHLIHLIPANPAQKFVPHLGTGHCARRMAGPDRDSGEKPALSGRSPRRLRRVPMLYGCRAQCW